MYVHNKFIFLSHAKFLFVCTRKYNDNHYNKISPVEISVFLHDFSDRIRCITDWQYNLYIQRAQYKVIIEYPNKYAYILSHHNMCVIMICNYKYVHVGYVYNKIV